MVTKRASTSSKVDQSANVRNHHQARIADDEVEKDIREGSRQAMVWDLFILASLGLRLLMMKGRGHAWRKFSLMIEETRLIENILGKGFMKCIAGKS